MTQSNTGNTDLRRLWCALHDSRTSPCRASGVSANGNKICSNMSEHKKNNRSVLLTVFTTRRSFASGLRVRAFSVDGCRTVLIKLNSDCVPMPRNASQHVKQQFGATVFELDVDRGIDSCRASSTLGSKCWRLPR